MSEKKFLWESTKKVWAENLELKVHWYVIFYQWLFDIRIILLYTWNIKHRAQNHYLIFERCSKWYPDISLLFDNPISQIVNARSVNRKWFWTVPRGSILFLWLRVLIKLYQWKNLQCFSLNIEQYLKKTFNFIDFILSILCFHVNDASSLFKYTFVTLGVLYL